MEKYKFGITSFSLHNIAMLLMLCDHLWATIIPGNMWLTNLGRIAFPIFSFMLVEGFFHTHNIQKYCLRLFLGALLSEIPFNLMYGGSFFYPYHQNVMWTFLISMFCMILAEKSKEKYKHFGIPGGILIFLAGTILGFITMVDYYGFGILTVGVFYFFHGDRWYHKILQLFGLYLVNVQLLGGMLIDITLFNHTFEVVQQGFALLAMIPILLYNKELGYHNKAIQTIDYLFYPVHMLILSIIALYFI